MLTRLSRSTRLAAAVAATLTLAGADFAEARAGRSGSFGSRGTRTYSAPAPTPTAPNASAPVQRSMTPQSGPQNPALGQQRPGLNTAAQARPQSRFGGGFFAGLLCAGRLGALFGSGFFGGLGGLTSILGLLLQVGLIVGAVMLVMRFLRSRNQPQPAFEGANLNQRMATGGLGGAVPPTGAPVNAGMGRAPAGAAAAGGTPIQIAPADFDTFERTLYAVQDAYAREDLAALRELATPEMVSYFAEDLAANARENRVNRISDVKLLQGDLSEAWREADGEYATVAMRFSLKDAVLDRRTNAVLEGSLTEPAEALEVWTFRRVPGGNWLLSAIQQS